MFLQHMEWNKVGIVYTEDDYGLGMYEFFTQNAEGFELSILNKGIKSIPADYTEETLESVREVIHEVMVHLVESHVRIIVYFGNAKVGVELCREGALRELAGELYMYVGPVWIDEDTQSMLEVHSDKDLIWEAMQGAIGIQNKEASEIKGIDEQYVDFKEDFITEHGTWNDYIPYVMDAVELLATALGDSINEGKDFNEGSQLIEQLRSIEMNGRTGQLKFPQDDANDREAIGYKIVNWHEMQDDGIKTIFYYNPLEA